MSSIQDDDPLVGLDEEFGNVPFDEKLVNCVRFLDCLKIINTRQSSWDMIYITVGLNSADELEELKKTSKKDEFIKHVCKLVVENNAKKPLSLREFLTKLAEVPQKDVVRKVVKNRDEILKEWKQAKYKKEDEIVITIKDKNGKVILDHTAKSNGLIQQREKHALILYKRNEENKHKDREITTLVDALDERNIKVHDFSKESFDPNQATYVFILYDNALGHDFDEAKPIDDSSRRHREFGRQLYREHIDYLRAVIPPQKRLHVFKINNCIKIDYHWLTKYDAKISITNEKELSDYLDKFNN